MIRNRLCLLSFLVLILLAPAAATAQQSSSAATSKAEAELRESIRLYDEALRRADVATAERYWAAEYVFINPEGERVSRDARIANLRERVGLPSIRSPTRPRRKSSTSTWTGTW